MGRPLTGSVNFDGTSWIASVPVRRGDRRRMTRSFPGEAPARAWVTEQVQRLMAGLDAEPPGTDAAVGEPAAPTGSTADRSRPGLDHYFDLWHHEYYVRLQNGDAERAEAVRDDFDLHLRDEFADLLDVDPIDGRERVVSWTRRMAGYAPEPHEDFDPPERTYARQTVSGLLWILTQTLEHALLHGAYDSGGARTPVQTAGIGALEPRGRKKRRPKLMSVETTASVAAHMHVIHQFVLWIARLCGLRISEAYGLIVANVVDDGEHMCLVIEAQGGRLFKRRDDDENVTTTDRKETTKTASGFRVIAIARQLAELIRLVIAAFHTDPDTGAVDYGARLIPAIRSRTGGQAGFRSALRSAAASVADASGDEDDYVVTPKDLRSHFATDIAWNPDLDRLVRRRAMGHRAGTDVFDLVYTLDDRLSESMRPVADAVAREVDDTLGTLVVPTTARPPYGCGLDRDRLAYADAVLEDGGWQVPDTPDGWITTEEAAAALGMSPTATRRLFPGSISAVMVDGAWRARLDDVLEYRKRLDGFLMIEDVATAAGVDYHTVYRTMQRLGIQPAKDDRSRTLLVTYDDARAVHDELARIAALEVRSVPVACAAKALRTKHSSIHAWARKGLLTYDPESDASGRKYITRESLEAERERRRSRRR